MDSQETAIRMWLIDLPQERQVKYQIELERFLQMFKSELDPAEDRDVFIAAFSIAMMKFAELV